MYYNNISRAYRQLPHASQPTLGSRHWRWLVNYRPALDPAPPSGEGFPHGGTHQEPEDNRADRPWAVPHHGRARQEQDG